MSSRTSAGKKKVKRLQPDSAPVQVKPQVVKVEFAPPPPQVIELKPEKKIKDGPFNWDTIEKSSLIITFATAILYLIGWSYELNWYRYFGISLSQVSLSIPQVLLRSLLTISTTFLLIFLVNLFYAFIRWLSYLGDYALALAKLLRASRMETIRKSNDTQNKDEAEIFSFEQRLAKNKWLLIISGVFILTLYSIFNNPYRYALNSINGWTSAIPPQIGVGVFILVGWTIFSTPQLVDGASTAAPKSFISFVKSKQIWATTLSIVYLIFIIVMAGSMAWSDAAVGKKDVILEDVPKVVLVGPKILKYMPGIEKHCDENGNCIYGLFGLIAENNNLYFLVKLTADQTGFDRNSGLYIIPNDGQSGTYFIMPDSLPIPTVNISPVVPTSLPTSSPVPTWKVTATPRSDINTATPTTTQP